MAEQRRGALAQAVGGPHPANKGFLGADRSPTLPPMGATPTETLSFYTGYDPEFDRTELSPIMYDEAAGGYTLGIPGMLVPFLETALTPGAIIRGYRPTPEDVTQAGMELTGGGLLTSRALGGVPEAALGMAAASKKGPKFNPAKAQAPQMNSLRDILYEDAPLTINGVQTSGIPRQILKEGTPEQKAAAKAALRQQVGQPITARVLAEALDKRALERLGGRPITPKDYTPETREFLAQSLAEDAIHAARQSGNAATWYRDSVARAHDIADALYANVARSNSGRLTPRQKAALNFSLAITSNGQTVMGNTRLADRVMRYYLERGRMPESLDEVGGGGGKEAKVMNDAFTIWNKMVDRLGEDEFNRFLMSDIDNKVLKDLGLGLSGEGAQTKLKGSAIFGPKIGQGFYQNLSGNYEPLTADRWWMKLWGRLTGNTATPPSKETLSARREKLMNAARSKTGKQQLKDLGLRLSDIAKGGRTPESMEALRKIYRPYVARGFKDGTDLERAAQRIIEGDNAVLLSPRGSKERQFMRDVADRAVDIVSAREGLELRPADLQALVWYPEKELYRKFNVGNDTSEGMDYEQAFRTLAEEQGLELRPGTTGSGAAHVGGPGLRQGVRSLDEGPGQAGSVAGQTGRELEQSLQALRDAKSGLPVQRPSDLSEEQLYASGGRVEDPGVAALRRYANGGRAGADPAQRINNVTYRQVGPGGQLAYGHQYLRR